MKLQDLINLFFEKYAFNDSADVDKCNAMLEKVEMLLPFKDDKEHEMWLDVVSSGTGEEIEDLTRKIASRRGLSAKKFQEHLRTIMKHNNYSSDMLDVNTCDRVNKWTPCDLVLREKLNNGCMSAQGFLGIKPSTCEKMYEYICKHKRELIAKNWVNEFGYNNWNIMLWRDFCFEI